jgi:hypothetical protein
MDERAEIIQRGPCLPRQFRRVPAVDRSCGDPFDYKIHAIVGLTTVRCSHEFTASLSAMFDREIAIISR